MIQEAPELRIVEDDLWNSVKGRQRTVKHATRDEDDPSENHFRDRRRPKYLLSGLTKCGCCGGGYSMISAHLVGCSTRRNKGTCDNDMNIRRDALEERVLNALRHNLMKPELFQEFCDEFTREMNKLRMEGRASIDAAEAEIKKIDRELDTLVDLILKGGAADRLNEKMVKLERRQKDLKAFMGRSR
ncbi:zinc ribbon domain-containing protein [Gemmobacter sp. 24YEA27]|uniref:zinc ribbon domain-containing protein n=1 Tax=Gemmobacter sp. 24YEA27 TaxID=3040672 RepID=UPI0032C41499